MNCDLCESEARYEEVVTDERGGGVEVELTRLLCGPHHDAAVVILDLFHVDHVGTRLW